MNSRIKIQPERITVVADILFRSLPAPEAMTTVGMRGVAGVLIFLSSYYQLSPSEEVVLLGRRYLSRIEALLDGAVSVNLYNGLAGAALAAYCWDVSTGVEAKDRYDDVLSLVRRVLAKPPSDMSFDLISGLTGVGALCHAMSNERSAAPALRACLSALNDVASKDSQGFFWETTVEFLPFERRDFGRPVRNLGLAHGSPGPIALLASGILAGKADDSSLDLLKGATNWVIQKLTHCNGRICVPYWDDDPREARLAWCYGSPGLGYALVKAGGALDDRAIQRLARTILLDGFREGRIDKGGMREPTLCHGYAGVAHLLQRSNALLSLNGLRSNELTYWADLLYTRALSDLEACALHESGPNNGINEAPWFDFLEGLTGATLGLLHIEDESYAPWEALLLTL